MNLVAWGIALIVIGLLLTFSNLFGFVLGAPIMWIGLILVAAGIVLAIYHYVGARTSTGRMSTRRGPLV